jgi:hypothetical protein
MARLLVQQARTQHVCKEVVVAVPPTPIVERDHEQLHSLQPPPASLSIVLPGDDIA